MSQWTGSRDHTAAGALAILAASNIVTHRRLPAPAYVPWNMTMAAVLVALARRAECDADALGLDPRHLRGGLTVGAAGAAAVTAAWGLVLATPAGRTAVADERMTSLSSRAWSWQAFGRLPLGTVMAEEIAFRGVLPAVLADPRRPAWVPGGIASLAFGLWHVLPSRDLHRHNDRAGRMADRYGDPATTAAEVLAMTAAGTALHGLRRRGAHLAAPMAVHLATNLLGMVAARTFGRRP